MKFRASINRNACTEDGSHCRACGRSHEKIMKTRQQMSALTDFILEMDYDNVDEFMDYLCLKVGKKIKYTKATQSTINSLNYYKHCNVNTSF